MAVYYKLDSNNTIHYSNTQADYSWTEKIWSDTDICSSHRVAIDSNPFVLEGDEEARYLFAWCENETIEHLDWIDTSNCTRLDCMFSDCIRLKSVDLHTWDTSKVTRLDSMFANCENLQSVNLIGWDVSSVEICGYMFYECQDLSEIKVDLGCDWAKEMVNLEETDRGGDMFVWCHELPGYEDYKVNIDYANAQGGYFTGVWSWKKHEIWIKEYED